MNPTEITHEMHTMNFVGNIIPGSWYENDRADHRTQKAIQGRQITAQLWLIC
jgi:hypothetical protein